MTQPEAKFQKLKNFLAKFKQSNTEASSDALNKTDLNNSTTDYIKVGEANIKRTGCHKLKSFLQQAEEHSRRDSNESLASFSQSSSDFNQSSIHQMPAVVKKDYDRNFYSFSPAGISVPQIKKS